MPLNIEIEVQDRETLTLEIIDAPFLDSVVIDDNAGLGDADVTWSADKSSRELADKVDKAAGMGLSELSFTTADKNSLDQSEQDRHTHANKSVIDDLSDNAGALEYRGLPVSDQAALDRKVDKAAGKGLSDTNFTQAEKDKLSSLESSKFVGLFVSESALPLSGSEGDYANVDGGVGSDVYRVIWDSSDNKWVRAQGVSTELTPAQIKQQYESNPDTNAFTDDEKAKLASVANGATANRADILNADKVHTHAISDVTGLTTRLNDIDSLIGDVESVLIAINGEPTP